MTAAFAVDGAAWRLPGDLHPHWIDRPDGTRIHCLVRRGGRPIVFVHGLGDRAGLWSPVVHALGPEQAMVLFDLRGHGRSVVGADGCGVAQAADDLAAVLDELDVAGAVVVGHSLGGFVTLAFCGRPRSELTSRVAAVHLSSCAARGMAPAWTGRGLLWADARLRSGRRLPRLVPSSPAGARWFVRPQFGDRRPTGAERELVEATISTPWPTWPAYALDLATTDLTNVAQDLAVPCQVSYGTKDRVVPTARMAELGQLVPDGRTVVFPGAGHQAPQERPVEFASALSGLLART